MELISILLFFQDYTPNQNPDQEEDEFALEGEWWRGGIWYISLNCLRFWCIHFLTHCGPVILVH